VLEFVASMNNFVVYHDTTMGNYKIHNGFRVISNPSTEEDAYRKLRFLNRTAEFADLKSCYSNCKYDCIDCERYS
jgi:hypothetical protein